MNMSSLALLLSVCVLTADTPSMVGWGHAIENATVQSKIKALQDKNNPERVRIARELGELGPRAKAAIPALMDALKDGPDLQEEASWALGQIGSAAVPSLLKAIEDRDTSVKIAAITALQWAGADAKPAVPTLVKVMKTGDRSRAHRGGRYSGLHPLSGIGPGAG
jgi:HEAT repeat protein